MGISIITNWLKRRETLIVDSFVLRAVFYSLIPGFVYAISHLQWTQHGAKSIAAICPAYFQSCESFYFLDPDWQNWSYRLFTTVLYLLLAGSGVQALRNQWRSACLLMASLFLVSAWMLLATNADISVPYVTFLLVPSVIVLFSGRPIDDLRISFVVLYVLAGTSKLHTGWIAGTYFASYNNGLPLLPDLLIPVATNAVILLEVFGTWWLISSHAPMRKIVLSLTIGFHAYSTILMGPQFAIQAVPFIWLLFHEQPSAPPKPSLAGAALVLILITVNLLPFALSRKPKLTYQGQSLAMSMFDANRRSISVVEYTFPDGSKKIEKRGSQTSWDVLKPYKELKKLQASCEPGVEAKWTFDSSIDDGPYHRIIDVLNACELNFKAFRYNNWINDSGPITGYPGKVAYKPSELMGKVPESYPRPIPQKRIPSVDWSLENYLGLQYIHIFLLILAPILVGISWIKKRKVARI